MKASVICLPVKFICLIACMILGVPNLKAQLLADTGRLQIDSAQVKTTAVKIGSSSRDPRRASLLSAILPGAGQVYNRKYWKLPILLGGAYTLGYFIKFNNDQYVRTRDAYILTKAGKPDSYNGVYSAEQLARLREYWRRNRDLLIIVSAFTYLLNIADAAVDAHLSSFDVSDDLSMRFVPTCDLVQQQPVFGLGLTVSIK